MPLATGTLLNRRYRIVEPLREGGSGEVYRAHDLRIQCDVVIKVLPAAVAGDPERLSRLEREARLLASLNHPHIARIYDLEAGAIVMELVEGPTLADRLKAAPLPLDEALAIARQIADALEAAHEKGIVHGDLKPANVKVSADGSVKVLDFGLATAGAILGTAPYTSPEQAAGKPVDKRADIWSFGIVLWEMLTGRRDGVAHASFDFSALPADTPPHVFGLVRRCLDRDVKTRLRDIGEARIALSREFEPVRVPASSKGRNSRWMVVTIVVLALIAGGVSYLHFREPPPPEAELFRAMIDPPRNTSFQAIALISPNGRMLAFSTVDREGYLRLWVQTLGSGHARVLAEIGDSSLPFWSPDSRWLAYAFGGELIKVEIATGNAIKLTDLQGAFEGGSWNQDGTILFGTSMTGVMRVPEAGGVPQPVTVPDASRNETVHMGPFFLPDGRHFLYYRWTGGVRGSAVYLGSLDSKPELQPGEPFLRSDALAQYAKSSDGGPGHLLFVRDSVLLAQPFDPDSLKLSGAPVPIAYDVNNSAGFASLSVSENGLLVYRSGTGRRFREPLTVLVNWQSLLRNPQGAENN